MDREVKVWLRANASQFQREMLKARAAVKGLGDEIDTSNDRTAWLAQGLLALGPALAPLGAVAVPTLAALATQATVGAGAIGAIALAFNGVGEALDALNKYQLEPTADNLAAVQETMRALGPDGAEFVRFLDQAGEQLRILQMDARAGMFPGMTDGIRSMLEMLPRLRDLVQEISSGVGTLARDAGAGLAGPEFEEFFEYLRTDARDILVDTGRIIGNFFAGFADLIVAFGPLTADFSDGLLGMSRDFERWAQGLSSSDGFTEFVDYVREATPMLLDFVAAAGSAFVELSEAAAPVADLMVPALTALLHVIAALADTPLGSIALMGAALASLYGRIVALHSITTRGLLGVGASRLRSDVAATKSASSAIGSNLSTIAASWATAGARTERESKRMSAAFAGLRTNISAATRGIGPAVGQVGLLTASMSGYADKAGLANTTSMALVGSFLGPMGTALGAGAGLILDVAAAQGQLAEMTKAANAAIAAGDIPAMTASLAEFQEKLTELQDHNTLDGFGDMWSDRWAQMPWNDSTDLGFNGLDNEIAQVESRIHNLNRAIARQEMWTKFAENQARVQEALRKTRAAIQDSADGFHSLGDMFEKPTLGLDKFIAQTEKAAEAAANIADNMETLLVRGADPEALMEVYDNMGSAAGLLFEQMVDGGKGAVDQFNRATGALESGEAKIDGVLRRIARDMGALFNMKGGPTLDVKDRASAKVAAVSRLVRAYGLTVAAAEALLRDLASGKIKSVQQLVDKYGMSKAEARALLQDAASGKLEAIIRLMNSVDGRNTQSTHTHRVITRYYEIRGEQGLGPDRLNRATGGLLRGPGGPTDDEIPLWGSNGEYMVRAAAVQRYGVAFFDALNAGRLTFGRAASGGGLESEETPFGSSGIDSHGGGSGQNPQGPFHLTPDPHGGFGLDGLRKQLQHLQDMVRKTDRALRGMNREVNQSERAMNKQERVLEKATQAYEKQADVVDQIQQSFDSLADAVRGSLTTALNTGLDGEQSPWAGPTDIFGVLMGTLTGDTSRARAFDDARDVIDDFIGGTALEQLIRELSPEQFIQVAGLSGAQLDQLEAALNLRDSVIGVAGAGAGDAVFGAELRAQTAVMNALHAVQQAELAEFKEFREEWRKDKSALRAMERIQRIQERQLEQLQRELEREKQTRKGARDGMA